MTTVRQLLDRKGHEVFSISLDATVYDAITKMAEKDVGSLLVVDDDKLVGIVTERDYTRRVALKGRTSAETPVQAIMETNIIYAIPKQTVEECMAVMTDKKIRYLPVIENESLIGIISIGDLVYAIISSQQFTIEQLESYICGSR